MIIKYFVRYIANLLRREKGKGRKYQTAKPLVTFLLIWIT